MRMLNPCKFPTHWGKRHGKNLDSLPPGLWEAPYPGTRPFSALKAMAGCYVKGKAPKETQSGPKLDYIAEKEYPSPSQPELPAPRETCLWLRPARPGSTNSLQSITINPSQPAPTNHLQSCQTQLTNSNQANSWPVQANLTASYCLSTYFHCCDQFLVTAQASHQFLSKTSELLPSREDTRHFWASSITPITQEQRPGA
ncbi:hypothetical protein AAY473_040437 [Plecturocebus cupreus]